MLAKHWGQRSSNWRLGNPAMTNYRDKSINS